MLGSYSVVRYSNNLNDQRVNVGVLVWHPVDGYKLRVAPSLVRVHAVNASVDLDEIDAQLRELQHRVDTYAKEQGELLDQLSRCYRDGLEVSSPYPARIYSLGAITDKLFDMLITPKADVTRPRVQAIFRETLSKALRAAVQATPAAGFNVEDLGKKQVNGVSLDLGIQVRRGAAKSLWHALSLQFGSSASAQVSKAKAAAMEIVTIREIPDFMQSTQVVALQTSGPSATHRDAAESWLKHAKAEVVMVEDAAQLPQILKQRLGTLQFAT